jgi:hypothetical protein
MLTAHTANQVSAGAMNSSVTTVMTRKHQNAKMQRNNTPIRRYLSSSVRYLPPSKVGVRPGEGLRRP